MNVKEKKNPCELFFSVPFSFLSPRLPCSVRAVTRMQQAGSHPYTGRKSLPMHRIYFGSPHLGCFTHLSGAKSTALFRDQHWLWRPVLWIFIYSKSSTLGRLSLKKSPGTGYWLPRLVWARGSVPLHFPVIHIQKKAISWIAGTSLSAKALETKGWSGLATPELVTYSDLPQL